MTHLMKSPMGSVVWFSILSMSFSSKNIISFTLISASSLVRTWRGRGGRKGRRRGEEGRLGGRVRGRVRREREVILTDVC